MVREISKALQKKNFSVQGISSDLEQNEREAALLEFKNKNTQILVATDILSRGIDIKDISLVINYDVPQDAEDYVHRVGRTARADTTGVALTFITAKDQHRFHTIETLIEREIMKIPLPVHLGKGPEYNPSKKRTFGGRGRNNYKSSRGRNGGNNRRNSGSFKKKKK